MRLTLDLTASQKSEIETNAKNLGWTVAHYLRTAVELVDQLGQRRGKLFLQEKGQTFQVLVPGVTDIGGDE